MGFDQALTIGKFDFRKGYQTTVGGLNSLRPADSHRVYLAISNFAGATIYIGNDQAVTSTTGQWPLLNGSMLEFFWERHAILLTLPWYFDPVPPGGVVVWTEVLYYAHR